MGPMRVGHKANAGQKCRRCEGLRLADFAIPNNVRAAKNRGHDESIKKQEGQPKSIIYIVDSE
jgi:hypothetical protein